MSQRTVHLLLLLLMMMSLLACILQQRAEEKQQMAMEAREPALLPDYDGRVSLGFSFWARGRCIHIITYCGESVSLRLRSSPLCIGR